MKRVNASKKNTKRRMRRGKRGGKFNDVSIKNILSFFGVQRKKGFSPQQIVEHSREVDTFDADTDYESDYSQNGGGPYYQSLDASVPDFGKDPDLNANDRRDSK